MVGFWFYFYFLGREPGFFALGSCGKPQRGRKATAPLHTPRAFFLEFLGCGVGYGVDFCLYASVLDVKRCAEGGCRGTVMRFSTCDARLRNSAVHVAYSREPQSMRYIRRGLRNLYYATIYPTEIYKVPFDTFRLSVELPIQKHTDTS